MNDDLDPDQRPASYFAPQDAGQDLLATVAGSAARELVRSLLAEGRYAEARVVAGASDALRSLESVHPMFMGGNYLSPRQQGEVEIGRISIASTTGDVTAVYARQAGAAIHYRVVDEYDGDTLAGPHEATSREPMSLGEFADFFLGAWPLEEVLRRNFGEDGDLDGALAFFTAESPFYPDFDRLCRQRMRARLDFEAGDGGTGDDGPG